MANFRRSGIDEYIQLSHGDDRHRRGHGIHLRTLVHVFLLLEQARSGPQYLLTRTGFFGALMNKSRSDVGDPQTALDGFSHQLLLKRWTSYKHTHDSWNI